MSHGPLRSLKGISNMVDYRSNGFVLHKTLPLVKCVLCTGTSVRTLRNYIIVSKAARPLLQHCDPQPAGPLEPRRGGGAAATGGRPGNRWSHHARLAPCTPRPAPSVAPCRTNWFRVASVMDCSGLYFDCQTPTC